MTGDHYSLLVPVVWVQTALQPTVSKPRLFSLLSFYLQCLHNDNFSHLLFSFIIHISVWWQKVCRMHLFCHFFTFVAQSTAYKIGHILLFKFSGIALLLFYGPSLFAWCFILNFLLHSSCLWINHVLFWKPCLQAYSWRIHGLGFVSCFHKKRLLVWGSNLNWVISLSDKFGPRLCVSFPFFMSAGG